MTGQVRGSQTDVVVDGVKQLILDGQFKPGQRLPIEPELAAMLGVSRGSLREGVRALSAMGVLESRQGSGTYVTGLEPAVLMAPLSFVVELQSRSDAVHLHSVRRILETAAARAAARVITAEQLAEAERWIADSERAIGAASAGTEDYLRADVGFHRVIAAASGNPVLEALIDALGDRTLRARLWRAVAEGSTERDSLAEHRAILDALRDGDADRAGIRMAQHLLGVEDFVRSTAGGRR